MASYRATVGIDYPPNKRVEAGEIVSDLPPQSVKWLLDMGLIEDSSKPAKKIEEPTPEPELTMPKSASQEAVVEPVVAESETTAEEE